MTDDEIKRARELCAAATPGPWKRSLGQLSVDLHDSAFSFRTMVRCDSESDAAFIAAARTLLPKALDEVELYKSMYYERHEQGRSSRRENRLLQVKLALAIAALERLTDPAFTSISASSIEGKHIRKILDDLTSKLE